MGAPYSAPPLWPVFAAFGGLIVWGYFCGRVRDKIASLFLAPSPLLALSIYYPGMFSQIGAVTSLSVFFLIFVVPGYLYGFFERRRKSKSSVLKPNKAVVPNVGSVVRFLLFILYTAAFFVSVLYLFGHSFPWGYNFAAVFVAVAAVMYVFLRKGTKRIFPL